jgi:hypothetical protein
MKLAGMSALSPRATWIDALSLGVPLGLAAFAVVTARAVVAFVDGPEEVLYGFPLFWVKAGATSLSAVVDAPAACVDLALYLVAAAAAARLWPRAARARAVRAAAWVVAVGALAAFAVVISADPYAGRVTFDSAFRWANVEHYSVYFGLPGLERRD